MSNITPYVLFCFSPDGLVAEYRCKEKRTYLDILTDKITNEHWLPVNKIRPSEDSEFYILFSKKTLMKPSYVFNC